jgi:hypothetical protein
MIELVNKYMKRKALLKQTQPLKNYTSFVHLKKVSLATKNNKKDAS